jgi:hypothetical protein
MAAFMSEFLDKGILLNDINESFAYIPSDKDDLIDGILI